MTLRHFLQRRYEYMCFGNVVLLKENHVVRSGRRCVDAATRSRWTSRHVLIVLLSDRTSEEARDGLSFVMETKLSLFFISNKNAQNTFYFNNIYIIITPKCFHTFISSSGSSIVVHLPTLHSVYSINIYY